VAHITAGKKQVRLRHKKTYISGLLDACTQQGTGGHNVAFALAEWDKVAVAADTVLHSTCCGEQYGIMPCKPSTPKSTIILTHVFLQHIPRMTSSCHLCHVQHALNPPKHFISSAQLEHSKPYRVFCTPLANSIHPHHPCKAAPHNSTWF
jgi:hypothetical protein